MTKHLLLGTIVILVAVNCPVAARIMEDVRYSTYNSAVLNEKPNHIKNPVKDMINPDFKVEPEGGGLLSGILKNKEKPKFTETKTPEGVTVRTYYEHGFAAYTLESVNPQEQSENGCGPTALIIVADYYGVEDLGPDMGLIHSQYPWGTNYGEVAAKAEALNFDVRMVNDASYEDLAYCIDHGIPPVVAVQLDGDPKNGHYYVVTGYTKDQGGKITGVYVAKTDETGESKYYTREEFDEMWNCGYYGTNNVMIAMAPKGSKQQAFLPQSNWSGLIEAKDNMVTGSSYIVHSYLDVFHPLNDNFDRKHPFKTFGESFIGFKEWGENIKGSPRKFFEGQAKFAKGAAQWITVKTGEFVVDVLDAKENAKKVWDGVKKKVKAVKEKVKEAGQDAVDTATDAAEEVIEDVTDAAEDAWDKVTSIF